MTEVWLIIILGGILTYLTRLSFILLVPPERLPEAFRRGLRLVPPAVLSALILPELLFRDETLNFNFQNERLLAGVIAAIIAWRTRNTWLTIGVGMLMLWGLSLI
jgi:branched-subunit amino acid transport protein